MQPRVLVIRLTLIIVCSILFYLSVNLYFKAFTFDISTNQRAFSKDQNDLEQTDSLISPQLIQKLQKEWDENLQIVNPIETGNPCDMKKTCTDSNKMPFKIVSGAANVIGPRICVNGVDLMRSVLNNVDRGMNIAVVDGRTGTLIDKGIFDLYAHDSTALVTFLKEKVNPREHALIFATSYDDAAMRLNDEARVLLKKLQFEDVDNLKFRDNFVFVGGIHAKDNFSKISKHDKNDKYGDWPAATEVEGCIEKL